MCVLEMISVIFSSQDSLKNNLRSQICVDLASCSTLGSRLNICECLEKNYGNMNRKYSSTKVFVAEVEAERMDRERNFMQKMESGKQQKQHGGGRPCFKET
jgi:hypothetical protein